MYCNKELDFTYAVCDNNIVVATFNPTNEHKYFTGHFPDFPIVPGVLLLEIAMKLVSKVKNVHRSTIKIKCFKKIRFHKPVFPDDMVELHMSNKGNEFIVNAYRNAESVFDLIILTEA